MTTSAHILAAASAIGLASCGAAAAAAIENHAPAGSDRAIRAVDFANRSYTLEWFGDGEDQMKPIAVVNREYVSARDEYDQIQSLYVEAPIYADVNRDGIEDAIVHETYSGGGTGRFDAAVVFTMKAGAVATLAVIPGGDRGDGGIVSIEPSAGGGDVKITRHQTATGDGACCASQLAIERWHWRGHELVRDDAATKVVANGDPDMR